MRPQCRWVVALALSTLLDGASVTQQMMRVPIGDSEALPVKKRAVERHGITWTFDRPYVVGTFANGDPWVVGPVRIVAISPRCAVVDDRVINGSMVDPDPSTEAQGFDSHCYGQGTGDRYVDRLNVARELSERRPLRLLPGQSLVSVESMPQSKDPPVLKRAAVLTCVVERPAPDAFRPPYVKGDKRIDHRVADLDFRVLRRLKPVGNLPMIEAVSARFEQLWLDTAPAWVTRYMHPEQSMPDYGRDIAALVGSAGVLLNLDLPKARKRELLVRFVQLGIDNHAKLRAGCRWRGLGGHGHGRKLPILVAGAVLHDERMLAIGREFISKPDEAGGTGGYFAEDSQTFYVEKTGDEQWNWGYGGYRQEHEGLPEWGFAHADTPKDDDATWEGNPYRRCCTANGWLGECLTARVMGLIEAWNHQAWFDYVDRYQQVEHTENWHRTWVDWHATMWAAYRPNH